MGCASSKGMSVDAAAPYRPAPASFAVFDINAIEEPWLKHLNDAAAQQQDQKPNKLTHVPDPILQKLNMLESTEAPQSWDEVSKALENLKPTTTSPPSPPTTTTTKPPPPATSPPAQQQPQPPRKTMSFHTLEELDAKLNPKPEPKPEPEPKPKPELTKGASTNWNKSEPKPPETGEKEEGGSKVIKPVKENIFIVRDRMERQKDDKLGSGFDMARRDPLSQFPEKCPPGGGDTVVLYTTSLGGVRKTYEECNRAREVLEGHRVVVDERDVSLHGEFLRELKELMEAEEEGGGGVKLPRVFVKGRYVGGLEELEELNESGRLGRILRATRVERGVGRQACGGCGGARFVPCFDCAGSCKVGATKDRCPHCNENGLVQCPACLSL